MTVESVGGWIVGVVAVLFTLIAQLRKSRVDESAIVLGKWKELVDTHEKAIASIREEFAQYKKSASEELEAVKAVAAGEAKALRERLREVEREFADYRRSTDEQIRHRDDMIAGLQRAIAQNSHSTAVQLARASKGVSLPEDSETIARLDRAGDNSIGKGGEDDAD